ncbi:MAG TPA: ferritin-like domain-containing protein [Gammaproteobacteria bacterium]|nr:ferritin-like domain-containing protein [Gammaproteobacteria bacterium]
MKQLRDVSDSDYKVAMGRLLVMYTQVDYLIMRAVAERIASAPDDESRLFMAKQVGDESRHVRIQQEWIKEFGTDETPVFNELQQEMFLVHFRSLNWLDFLTDMYICIEALGGEAVEQIVPMADPGTRASLKVPLQDEVDHIAFGLGRVEYELSKLPVNESISYLKTIETRLDFLDDTLHGLGIDVPAMFTAVGADYRKVVDTVLQRRQEIMDRLAQPLAA